MIPDSYTKEHFIIVVFAYNTLAFTGILPPKLDFGLFNLTQLCEGLV